MLNRRVLRLFCAGLCTALMASAVNGRAESSAATDVLTATKARGGLCLLIGVSRGERAGLAAELAGHDDRLVVHALATDDAALIEARRVVETKGVATRVTIDKVALPPLPYLNDLANLVVVENVAAITRLGVTQDELLRVLAPGGALCIKEGRRWKTIIKPRPKEMDDWTHPQHGADGNMVSSDKIITFPVGFRWINGLPMTLTRWVSCRGMVFAGGRCFTFGVDEPENLGRKPLTTFLTASDAFNGLPLWKVDCGASDEGGANLNWRNAAPLVADAGRVYVGLKDKIIGVDGSSGQITATYPVKAPVERLLLTEGVLIASCWQGRTNTNDGVDGRELWATWLPKSAKGGVEAFDAGSGKSLWSVPFPAFITFASKGVVYMLTHVFDPAPARAIVAVDIKTGVEKWRVPHTQLGNEPDLGLSEAGPGYVVVTKRGNRGIFVLSADNGKTLMKINPAAATQLWTPIVDDMLWYSGKKFDPLTGEERGVVFRSKDWLFWGEQSYQNKGCVPSAVVGGRYITTSRWGKVFEVPAANEPKSAEKVFSFGGVRGACILGMVPANGMFYTAQNGCRCMPGQVYGFLAVGPCGEWPSAAEHEKARVVGKGKSAAGVSKAAGTDDWPGYRHDAARSGATPGRVPAACRELWRATTTAPGEGPLASARQARLASCLSAPVVSGGRVLVAETDAGRIVALNMDTGRTEWTALLGGRVDTPPTVNGDECIVGCHDGYVYSLRLTDGSLIWRSRIAPRERRMVAYGEVESVWPVIGTVLVSHDVAYACAGRSSEADGGIALVAMNAKSGETIWARAIGTGPQRQNDFLRFVDGAIGWHHLRFDPANGATNASVKASHTHGGMIDGTWTITGQYRSGEAFGVDGAQASIMAWSDDWIAARNVLVPRNKPTAAKPAAVPWQPQFPGHSQTEAIALASNAVVYGGRISNQGSSPKGFLLVAAIPDGHTLGAAQFDAPVTYDGVAVANGRIFVSLQNGTLICFGESSGEH